MNTASRRSDFKGGCSVRVFLSIKLEKSQFLIMADFVVDIKVYHYQELAFFQDLLTEIPELSTRL